MPLLGDLVGQHGRRARRQRQDAGQRHAAVAPATALLVRASGDSTADHTTTPRVRASGGKFATGAQPELRVDASARRPGQAQLSYLTAGLGWRASYVGDAAHRRAVASMQFESRASIANRSGTRLARREAHPDRRRAAISAKPSAPRPMMAMAFRGKAARRGHAAAGQPGRLPQLPLPVAGRPARWQRQPGAAVCHRTIDCERTALYENGNNFQPPQPMIDPRLQPGRRRQPSSARSQFKAFDSLPAGYLRVLTARPPRHAAIHRRRPHRGHAQGRRCHASPWATRSTCAATRERTRFQRRQGRPHAGRGVPHHTEQCRRQRPHRDRARTSQPLAPVDAGLVQQQAQSADAPTRWSSASTVPAGGKATLDYAVRYSWTADDTAAITPLATTESTMLNLHHPRRTSSRSTWPARRSTR